MSQNARQLYLDVLSGDQCEACGAVPRRQDLEVHHRYGYQVPEAPRNLVALCKSCHARSDPQRVGEPTLEAHREIAADYPTD